MSALLEAHDLETEAGDPERQWREIVAALTRRELIERGAGLGLAALLAGPDVALAAQSPPVRIKGRFGETVLRKRPTRIVTVGQEPDLDAVVQLGVVPVGAVRDTNAASGIEPWTRRRIHGAPPKLLATTGNGLPYEQIAALDPDLIVATTYYGLAADHRLLSKIAPVLAYVTGPNTDSWQTTTRRVGQALGREAQAAALVQRTDALIASDCTRYSDLFAGKTFTFGPVLPNGQVYTTSSRTDLSAALLEQLGLVLSPTAAALPPSSTAGKSTVSSEQLDLIDADVVILTYISTAEQATFEANPLFQQLGAVRRGAYIALPLTTAVAMAFPSALSIAYALGSIVPLLVEALR